MHSGHFCAEKGLRSAHVIAAIGAQKKKKKKKKTRLSGADVRTVAIFPQEKGLSDADECTVTVGAEEV